MKLQNDIGRANSE